MFSVMTLKDLMRRTLLTSEWHRGTVRKGDLGLDHLAIVLLTPPHDPNEPELTQATAVALSDELLGKLPSLNGPSNDPSNDRKPEPIRHPFGYMLRLNEDRHSANSGLCSKGDYHKTDHKGLKEALDAFGVDIGEPVFDRIMQALGLEGLTPMERFMKEL